MALLEDIMKGFSGLGGLAKSVPLPTAQEVPSFSNTSTPIVNLPAPSATFPNFVQPYNPVFTPTTQKQSVTQVPTVAQPSNSIDFSSSTTNTPYINPFASNNIQGFTPFTPQPAIFSPMQPQSLDSQSKASFSDLFTDPFTYPLSSNQTPQANIKQGYFEAKKDDLVQLSDEYKVDNSSMGLFQKVINFLQPTNQADFENTVNDADKLASKSGEASKMRFSDLFTDPFSVPGSKDQSYYNERQVQENITAKTFLDKAKELGVNVDKITSVDEEKYQNYVNQYTNNPLFQSQKKLSTGLYNAQSNMAETIMALDDRASELAVYDSNNQRQYDRALAEGRYMDADRIKLQLETNGKNIMDKDIKHIDFLTNYKTFHPDAGDAAAEDARARNVQQQGYKDVNAYYVEGLVNRFGNKITKEEANNDLLNVGTRKDKFNAINNYNDEGSIIGAINNTVGDLLITPASRIINSVISNPLKGGVILLAGSPMGSNIKELSKGNSLQLFSQTAQADNSSQYGIDASNIKKTMGDKTAHFFNTVGDKAPEFLANIALIVATEGAGSASALSKVGYAGDLAKATSAATKYSRLGRVGAEFLVKNGLKEVIQNAGFDSMDPNATSQSNLLFNALGAFGGLAREARGVSRELQLLANEDVLNRINKRIEGQRIADARNAEPGLSYQEAYKRFIALPDSEKGTIATTREALTPISDMFSGFTKRQNDELADLTRKLEEAPDAEKGIRRQQILEKHQIIKQNLVEQEFITKALSGDTLTREQALNLARLTKDMNDPRVLVPDMITIMRRGLNNGGDDVLAGAATEISKNGRVNVQNLMQQGDYIFKDSGVLAGLTDLNIGILPGGKYTLTDMEKAATKSESLPNKEGAGVAKQIMTKDEDGFKYFDNIGTEVEPVYQLNEEGLKRINAQTYDSSIKIRNEVLVSAEKGTDEAQSFYDAVNKAFDESPDSLKMTSEEVTALKDSDAYTKLKNIIDDFIPCS